MNPQSQYSLFTKLTHICFIVFCIVGIVGCSNNIQTKESTLKGNIVLVALKAWNGKYVSVVEDSVGLRLIADKDKVGERETFHMEYHDENVLIFKAFNKFFVSADYSKGNFLFADKMEPREWEQFVVEDRGNHQVALKSSNGKYVCADKNIGFFIIADKDIANDWEKFSIVKISDLPSDL